MSTFKVGDVAIGRNHITRPDRNGMECEIIEPLQLMAALECRLGRETTKLRYGVRWADGLVSGTPPHGLRKQQLPPSRRQIARQVMRDCIDRALRVDLTVCPSSMEGN